INLLDILGDPIQTKSNTLNPNHSSSSFNPLEDVFFDTDIPTNPTTKTIPSMTAIDKNGIRMIFTFERDNTTLTINSKITNSTQYSITNFIFKAAVPK
ncbi:unnamed protein product, partial [Adineta steineri]